MPLANSWPKPLLGDINNNGRVELYGCEKDYYSERSEIRCYEQDLNGIFKPAYIYPKNTTTAYNIFDINGDGTLELHLVATHLDSASGYIVHDQTFFKKLHVDSLATQFYFDYNIYTGDGFNIQLNDFKFEDFNKDKITDAIFHSLLQAVRLVKFHIAELTFDSVYTYSTFIDSLLGNEFVAGFTIGDFDQDSKTDIVFSSEYGNIYIIENEGGDEYSINWEGNSGIWNSYINFKTDDIDKNGKPEFWVGGESFVEGVTRLVCFETDGDNSYSTIAEIEFPGLLTLNSFSGMIMDVDNDENEELILNVGNIIVIIKFIGSVNNHNYDIFYYHNFEHVVESMMMYKATNQKYPSMVLSMYNSQNGWTRDFSQFFQYYLTTNTVDEEIKVTKYQLFNNYPNPFNPATSIKFTISERSEVNIKVYNSLGEEVITLLDQSLERGEHTVTWNGTNQNISAVPSGIYFISMEAGSFHQTIKSVLIK